MDLGSLTGLDLPIQLQILSLTPGRVRLRLGPAWQDPDVMETIEQALSQFVPTLQRVKTNSAIGTLTLYFDPDQDSGEALFERLTAMGLITLSPTVLPSASQRLTHLTSAWNQRVNQWTAGTADLRFLVPLALALLALRRWGAKGNGLKAAPWYVLAWYAFDSFMKLNPGPAADSRPLAAADPGPVGAASPAETGVDRPDPGADHHNGQSAPPRRRKRARSEGGVEPHDPAP